LRKFLLILSIILLTFIHSRAQSVAAPLSDVNDRIVKLYPNPATSFVTFDLQKSANKGLSLQVYSFLGKKMYEAATISQKLIVDLADFNRGVYIYHLRDQSGKIIESGKFQVSK